MPVPKVDQAGNGAVDALVQTASKQAVVLAREQVDVARRELTARARQAVPGVAMVGGGAVLAAMASGTGTAGMILLLAGRPRPAAAAFGVTGAYAGAGVLLAREGLGRLRDAGPLTVPEAPAPDADQGAPICEAIHQVGEVGSDEVIATDQVRGELAGEGRRSPEAGGEVGGRPHTRSAHEDEPHARADVLNASPVSHCTAGRVLFARCVHPRLRRVVAGDRRRKEPRP